ncbi:XRE family transcriptional regulator [Clostridium botulinum]|nr:XRE family transcriptional regulator [Clostridium botulinum]NFL38435.1 XRE family transcriptional regulator [Clostridium botulinum]NFL65875.1 XRE family transcriptional regulator [Clostridium botulinum]NFN08272.1 XRE family transcriptional regulator [Clostridium botulinum]NFN24415.1 XRE family transcriptional regulator [Clostridium botulinum]
MTKNSNKEILKMLGDRIREIRTKNKISLNKLSRMTGISLGYLSDLENNKATNPSVEKLNLIAIALNVSTDLFFKNDIEKWDTTITKQLKEEVAIYDSINKNKSNIINLPIVGSVRAGEPILAIDNIEGYLPTLKSFVNSDKNYFYLRVQGDSMNQEFDDGSLLLIEKSPCVENGAIGVVLIDGMAATVKKIIQNNNMITLIPMSNNSDHVPKMYDIIKDQIQIVGKVKQAIKIY